MQFTAGCMAICRCRLRESSYFHPQNVPVPMKSFFLLLLFSPLLFLQGEDRTLINTTWYSPGAKFDAPVFTMSFGDSSVLIASGYESFRKYERYILKNDTLTIIYFGSLTSRANAARNSSQNRFPQFSVLKKSPDELLLVAINLRALYISSILSSSNRVSEEEFLANASLYGLEEQFKLGQAENSHLRLCSLKAFTQRNRNN
jgi:hypothetical protein